MINNNLVINRLESEYDCCKLVCAWCHGHVDKDVFVNLFSKEFFVDGMVNISEDDIHHHYIQIQDHLDGDHLVFDDDKGGHEFLDECSEPSPVTLIYGKTVNDVYPRLKSRAFLEKETRETLVKNANLAITFDAYGTYKYDGDYVDLIIYNKDTYAHIVFFDCNITVFREGGDEVMNVSFKEGDFDLLLKSAVEHIV